MPRLTDYATPISKDHFKTPHDSEGARKLARAVNGMFRSVQGAAATATAVPIVVAEGTGAILNVRVLFGSAAPGVGESMTFDVLKNGTSVLTAVITVNTSSVTRTFVEGTLKTDGTPNFVLGDILTTTRTYVAGTPTPLASTLLIVEFEYGAGPTG